jgi:hypothetical protein
MIAYGVDALLMQRALAAGIKPCEGLWRNKREGEVPG